MGVGDLRLLEDGGGRSGATSQPPRPDAVGGDGVVEEARGAVPGDVYGEEDGDGTENGSRETSVSGSVMDVDDVGGAGASNESVGVHGDEELSSRGSTLTGEDEDEGTNVLEPIGRKRRGRAHSDVDGEGEARVNRRARGAVSVGRKRGRLTK